MENFASDFKGHNGLTPEETKVSNIPRELSTGKIINDHNVAILEQVANQKGYKSNFWIYGHELNRLQKEIGSLNYKPKTTPVLCSDNNFYVIHLLNKIYIFQIMDQNKKFHCQKFKNQQKKNLQNKVLQKNILILM